MIWDNLLSNPGVGVDLGRLAHSRGFHAFVETIPALAEELEDEMLNIRNLMFLQRKIIRAWADVVTGDTQQNMRTVASALDYYDHAELFLDAVGVGVDGHCYISGMTTEEIWAMKEGRLQVGKYIVDRPSVFLSPVLNQLVSRH